MFFCSSFYCFSLVTRSSSSLAEFNVSGIQNLALLFYEVKISFTDFCGVLFTEVACRLNAVPLLNPSPWLLPIPSLLLLAVKWLLAADEALPFT